MLSSKLFVWLYFYTFCRNFVEVQAFCYGSIEKVTCSPSKTQCTDAYCNVTYLDRHTVELNWVGCTLTRTHQVFSLQTRHEIRTTKNWNPGAYNAVVSMCDMAKGANLPFLNVFFTRDKLESILHNCPYLENEKMYLTNMTINTRTIPSIGGKGKYRLSFTIMSGKYLEVFTLVFHGSRCVAS